MAPSSLKKMSGSKGRKEGNYASSDRSTSVDVFTSDDLGLTLLPRPQIQKKDVGEKVQAAIGRPTTICTIQQQGDGQHCPLELEEQCHPVTRRSTVDESIGGSCYFQLSKKVEGYLNTGSYDLESVLRPDDCCSRTQGKHDLKSNGFSLSTDIMFEDTGNDLHHDRKDDTNSQAPYRSSLAKQGQGIKCNILFNSSNQMLKGEVRKISLNGASDSLESVIGNEHDCGGNYDAKAYENPLTFKFWGLKGKKPKNFFLSSASGNIGGLTFTKPITDNGLSKDYPLAFSTDTGQKPYHSTRTSESENTNPAIPETNRQSHIASALLVPVEPQSPSKAIPTTHQQALDSLLLSPQLILTPLQVARNFHAAPPKKASRSGKHLKRSWTMHFPTGSKDLPSKRQYSDHPYTSSATPSCSIASKTRSNSLKTGFACENHHKRVTHPNSRILASSPPPSIQGSSQAYYDLERATSNNVDDTVRVQSRLKAGIKRSNSLPDSRLLHRSLNMHLHEGHQPSQFSQPPWGHQLVGDNPQYEGPNYSSPPTNHAAQSTLRDTPGDINTPLMEMPYEQIDANISQPGHSLADSGMGVPVHGLNQYNVGNTNGPNHQPIYNYTIPTNNGLTQSNGERLYTAAESGQRLQNLENALDQAHEQNRVCKAKYLELYRSNEDLRQQLNSETAKHGKSPKDGVQFDVANMNGPNHQPIFDYTASANDGLTQSNGERLYNAAELGQRLQNLENDLDYAREENRFYKARNKDLERSNEVLRQQLKSETAKNGKSPKDGVKTKSSRNRSVLGTVEFARQSYPTADQQSLNARSASLRDIPIPLTNGNDGPSLESGATMDTMASPTQRQHAAVPAPEIGYPSTQADDIQAPWAGPFRLEDQILPGSYNPTFTPVPTYSSNTTFPLPTYASDPTQSHSFAGFLGPTYPPNSQPFGQYLSHEIQPGHLFQIQENQSQQNPHDHSVGIFQQSPQLLVSRTPPAAVHAEASTSGIKRKSESETDAAQGAKRQQQHVETQPSLLPAQAASDEQAHAEAWRKMSQKTLDWLDGVNPFKQDPKEGIQFGIPSATLPQAATNPAMAPQAPKEVIAPMPGKAPRKTKQKTSTKRKAPKTELEQKAQRAVYNKRYKDKKKRELLEKNKAAENLEASETTLPLSNANGDNDPLPGTLSDSAQEEDDNGNEQSSDLDADFEEDPETQETNAETADNKPQPDDITPEVVSYFEDAMGSPLDEREEAESEESEEE